MISAQSHLLPLNGNKGKKFLIINMDELNHFLRCQQKKMIFIMVPFTSFIIEFQFVSILHIYLAWTLNMERR